MAIWNTRLDLLQQRDLYVNFSSHILVLSIIIYTMAYCRASTFTGDPVGHKDILVKQ